MSLSSKLFVTGLVRRVRRILLRGGVGGRTGRKITPKREGGVLLHGSYKPRVDGTSNLFNKLSGTHRRRHWEPVNKLQLFLPSTIWPSGNHLTGMNQREVEITIE